MGWTKLPADLLLGLARISGAGTGRVVRVSRETAGWFRSLVGSSAPSSQAPLPLEEAIRRSLFAEIAQGHTALAPADVERLVTKIADLLRKVLAGELSLDAIPPLASFLRPSRLVGTRWEADQPGSSEASTEKKDILRKILQENLELRALLKPEEEQT